MTRNKWICLILVAILSLSVLFGCGQSGSAKIGLEVGKWHAELKVSDLRDSMSDDDRLVMSMLAGNIMLEVDAEFCEDGTFTYEMNTDKLEEAVSDTISTVFGFFFDFDISLFTDRLLETAMQNALQGSKQDYWGTYTKDENDLITAVDGESLYFKASSSRLVQLDAAGNEVLTFKKVS